MASADDGGFIAALEEAKTGAREGGIPIGAALVDKDGKILGVGHNLRVQKSSAILHGETSALEAAGRLPATRYAGSTMYTTLSPCAMCAGACVLYGVKRVVVGENTTFTGAEAYLRSEGIEVVVLEDRTCEILMREFIRDNPAVWYEDIGVSGWQLVYA